MNAQGKRSGETAREYAYRMIREQVISLELKPGEAFKHKEKTPKKTLGKFKTQAPRVRKTGGYSPPIGL